MKFSILICHLEERKRLFDQLMARLKQQLTSEAEVLYQPGPGTIGMKRNQLLNRASGDYIAYVDDDDTISYEYVDAILGALETEPDCVGIQGEVLSPGKPAWAFRHSITVDRWCKDKDKRIYFRTPNHLNPIKRDYALKVGFDGNSSWGEDRDYSERIRPYLKTEVFVEKTLYYYRPDVI